MLLYLLRILLIYMCSGGKADGCWNGRPPRQFIYLVFIIIYNHFQGSGRSKLYTQIRYINILEQPTVNTS